MALLFRGRSLNPGQRPGPAAAMNAFSVIFAVLLVLSIAVALLLVYRSP
jgi:hypothetical protein